MNISIFPSQESAPVCPQAETLSVQSGPKRKTKQQHEVGRYVALAEEEGFTLSKGTE